MNENIDKNNDDGAKKKIVVSKKQRVIAKKVLKRKDHESENSDNPLLSKAPNSSTGVNFLNRRNRQAKEQEELSLRRRTANGISEERDMRNLDDAEKDSPSYIRKTLNRFR